MLGQLQDESNNIEWVEKHLDVRSVNGPEYSVVCPIHDDTNPSMGVNVEKGVFLCRSCGAKGSLKTLANAIGVEWNGGSTEYSIAMLRKKINSVTEKSEIFRHVESELKRFNFDHKYWTDPIPDGRGFSSDIVKKFEFGYDYLNDAVTIPIRDLSGRFLGVTRRYLSFDADKRYKDPKGFSKGTTLYAAYQSSFVSSDYLVICEGPLDAVAVWNAGHTAVAQFGSTLTKMQRYVLDQLSPSVVILAYDSDKAGEKATSRVLGFDMDTKTRKITYDPENDLRRKYVVKKISYYRTLSKDPGGMQPDILNAVIHNALESERL